MFSGGKLPRITPRRRAPLRITTRTRSARVRGIRFESRGRKRKRKKLVQDFRWKSSSSTTIIVWAGRPPKATGDAVQCRTGQSGRSIDEWLPCLCLAESVFTQPSYAPGTANSTTSARNLNTMQEGGNSAASIFSCNYARRHTTRVRNSLFSRGRAGQALHGHRHI